MSASRVALEAAREERRTGAWEYRIVLATVGVLGLHIVDQRRGNIRTCPRVPARDTRLLTRQAEPLLCMGFAEAL
jgi:hypothetical protein